MSHGELFWHLTTWGKDVYFICFPPEYNRASMTHDDS